MQLETEICTQDILSQQTIFLGLLDSPLQPRYRQRILSATVDVTFSSADGISTKCHTFQQAMGITLNNGAIHEGPGVTFVSVTDDILDIARSLGSKLPLEARQEACTTSTTEPRIFYLLNDLIWGHFKQSL